MKSPTTLLTVLLSCLLQTFSAENDCVKDDKCNCYRVPEYEFQCPPDSFEIIVHAVPDKHLKIDCYNLTDYDLNVYPDFNAGNLDYFLMSFCPLPADDFQPTMEHFNITRLKNLYLDECYSKGKVSKELLRGLSSLDGLSLSRITQQFDVDMFKDLRNLTQLYLDRNNITEIGYMFDNNPKLKVLHLSRNLIRSIPSGLFKNLPELQQLHLWSNALSNITKESFIGLKNLKSLELSSNNIQHIEEGSFSELVSLVNISLRSNKLEVLSGDLFKNNKLLEYVRIGDNPNLILPDYLFSDLPKLTNINLFNCKLNGLPENVFSNSSNLITITLSNNEIEQLPENVFRSQTKLKTLDLSRNKIFYLPNKVFSSLEKLEELNLRMNALQNLNLEFSGLRKLKRLDLSYNAIETISPNTFIDQTELISLDLSNNLYNMTYTIGDFVEPVDPFTHCQKLRELNLRHNHVMYFTNLMLTHPDLVRADFSHNNISFIEVDALRNLGQHRVEIDLSHNEIAFLDFTFIKASVVAEQINYDALHNNATPSIVSLQGNPFVCNCHNFDLAQYLQDDIEPLAVKTLIDLRIGDSKCSEPPDFRHISLADKGLSKRLTCALNTSLCPESCDCFTRSYDKATVVDCSGRNLTEYPEILFTDFRVELNLMNNLLEEGPEEHLNYTNVKNLLLSNNKIKSLKWLPLKVEVVKLDNNQLNSIDSSVLNNLNKWPFWKSLTLANNPWSCGCSALDLQNFLNDHYTKVTRNDVICQEDNVPLVSKEQLCRSYVSLIVRISLPILSFLLLSAVTIALYFRFKREIKVWLYAKNLCLWFVSEEELDKDKEFDVFLSYSHLDEDFVVHNLLPVLQSGPHPFKTLIHIRDWKGGELITTQIANSVANSRRTLIVLSDNYLESVWGKLEFRTAHTQAIEEGIARVIVVKYGELTEEKLDEDLKSYLKTNTYVEWGKPWFWNKLKYALPHSPQTNFYHSNQRHASVMLKIDDKFELTAKPETHPESTPPVLLDPALLKNHPLNFNPGKDVQTPPAEAPLINR